MRKFALTAKSMRHVKNLNSAQKHNLRKIRDLHHAGYDEKLHLTALSWRLSVTIR